MTRGVGRRAHRPRLPAVRREPAGPRRRRRAGADRPALTDRSIDSGCDSAHASAGPLRLCMTRNAAGSRPAPPPRTPPIRRTRPPRASPTAEPSRSGRGSASPATASRTCLIAWLALQIAFGGGGGEQANQKGAFQQLTDNTFGKILLWIIVVGFVAVGCGGWARRSGATATSPTRRSSCASAAPPPSRPWSSSRSRCWPRAPRSAAGGGGNGQQKATAGVLGLPGGQWIVGLVGLGIIVAGGSKIYAGWKKKFEDDMNMPSDQKARQAVERTGQIGSIAKGVSIGVIGVLVVIAADPVRPGEGGRARRGAALARPDPARAVAARRGGPRARRVRRVLLRSTRSTTASDGLPCGRADPSSPGPKGRQRT